MTVKIITDRNSDISPELARDLGITVVPAYIQSSDEANQEGMAVSNNQPTHQAGSSPEHPEADITPEDFARIYLSRGKKADGILSIHASSKTSDIYDTAIQGKKLTKGKYHIEVIDSTFTSIGLALVVIAAAKSAKEGENLLSVFEETQEAIGQVSMLALLDSTEYLNKDSLISKLKVSTANMLKMKPLFTFRKGELVQTALVRKYPDGLDRLQEFAASHHTIQDMAIAYSTAPEQAEELKARLGSIFPEEDMYFTQLGSVPGIFGSPGVLVIALRHGHY